MARLTRPSMGSGYAQLKLSKFIPEELVTRASMHSAYGCPNSLTARGRSMASCLRGISASMHVMAELPILYRDRDVT